MKQREIWIDNIKVIACILVVLGHFFQSMRKAGILSSNDLLLWFDQTIYYFHVPLFFICSGYLYQKRSRVNDLASQAQNIFKKAMNLGVPYFTFSFATWFLKTAFSDATNGEIGGLVDTLFVHPTAPYWYLYALFFIFLITPTFCNKKNAWISLIIALSFKVLSIIGVSDVQAITYVLSNEIWFVLGMCLSELQWKRALTKKWIIPFILLNLVFLCLSIMVYMIHIRQDAVSFVLGLIACFSIITLMIQIYEDRKQSLMFGILAKYTMPIFLMHTLFAAPLRILLFKIGIQNVVVHVIFGLSISFVGPIIAAKIAEKTRWLEFFIYPRKILRKQL